MSEQIKSLADEIREKLRGEQVPAQGGLDTKGELAPKENTPLVKVTVDPLASLSGQTSSPAPAYTEAQVAKFFQQLEAFPYHGEQKSMIRVDARTMKLLRHLKLVRGIEMNKVIVFALHQLLARHSWLVSYIQDSLKDPDL
uniref:hypothetical protein n=1 Tax=Pedobacter schmidteae TaxID=2201271 RepID=UPI000EB57557|nr:hypothetical protein [Pedobacter schmidteae]